MHVLSLDGEDPLEEGMAPHSGILTRKFSWREMPGRVQGCKALDVPEVTELAVGLF